MPLDTDGLIVRKMRTSEVRMPRDTDGLIVRKVRTWGARRVPEFAASTMWAAPDIMASTPARLLECRSSTN